jgi:hypothetical protein
MSLISALARLRAADTGAAQPLAAYRHHHLSQRPLVLVQLTMAGEAGAPLAVIVGSSRRQPEILMVPQPRDRGQRFEFAADLGRIVVEYIDSFRTQRTEVPATKTREESSRYTDAPQILVPNPGGIRAMAQLGRMTRFRRADGPYPVDPVVPECGAWLTFLVERAEYAGTCVLMAMTDLLAAQWATGQSALEDQNLASLLGWIDPPDGMTGLQAALAAEDPEVWPPAGPATNPEFDNRVLAPAIELFDDARRAGDTQARKQAEAALHEALASQLRPVWDQVWHGVSLLGAVPQAPGVAARWAQDCAQFTAYSDYLGEGGAPQPKRDYPIAAAIRLARLEQAQSDFEVQRALDDPYALADLRTAGEAFGGTVLAVEANRVVVSDKNRKMLRPRFTLETSDPLRAQAGTKLISPTLGAAHKAVLVDAVALDDGRTEVTVEITGGMGSIGKPSAQAVPREGDDVVYLPDPGYRPAPVFPAIEQTPWTHGGPPVLSGVGAVPLPAGAAGALLDDAGEEWGPL